MDLKKDVQMETKLVKLMVNELVGIKGTRKDDQWVQLKEDLMVLMTEAMLVAMMVVGKDLSLENSSESSRANLKEVLTVETKVLRLGI